MKTSEKGKTKAKPVEPEKCVCCGKMTASRDYILNPGAGHELPCCGAACYEYAQAFVARDKKFRMPFYLILTVLVVANVPLWPDAGYPLEIRAHAGHRRDGGGVPLCLRAV